MFKCRMIGAAALLCLVFPAYAQEQSMEFVTSADGTTIAYTEQGTAA